MMHWKQLIYAGLTSAVMMPILRACLTKMHVAVLMYHELGRDDADIEAWTVVRESDFLRQVEYLDRHYDVVSLDQALMRMQSGQPSSRPMAVLTFDDGDRGNADVLLPIVERLKMPVAVYVATQQVTDGTPYWFDRVVNVLQTDGVINVDLQAHGLKQYVINQSRGAKNWVAIQRLLQDLKTLAPETRERAVRAMVEKLQGTAHRADCHIEPAGIEDIQALAACELVTIGSHSHCHNILTQLAPIEVERSLRMSKTLLEKWIKKPVDHFAYPNGSYNKAVLDVVHRVGFRSAVTTEQRLYQRPDPICEIPRIAVGRYDSLDQFKLNLLGGIGGLMPWRRGRSGAPGPMSSTCTP